MFLYKKPSNKTQTSEMQQWHNCFNTKLKALLFTLKSTDVRYPDLVILSQVTLFQTTDPQ